MLKSAQDTTEHLYRGMFMSFTAQEEQTTHMQPPESAEVARPAVAISCSNVAFWRLLLKTRLRSGEAAGLQAQHFVGTSCWWSVIPHLFTSLLWSHTYTLGQRLNCSSAGNCACALVIGNEGTQQGWTFTEECNPHRGGFY